jgi:hypothetical protein
MMASLLLLLLLLQTFLEVSRRAASLAWDF